MRLPTRVLLLCLLPQSWAGYIKATLPVANQGDDDISSMRQKVCERYLSYTTGAVELQNSLSGFQLHPVLTQNKFFKYDFEKGFDEDDPGLLANILDELASPRRANFTWRTSFAVTTGPGPNETWTDMLVRHTEMYDISVLSWDKNSLRLSKGIAFLEQWFDGNMILIEKIEPVEPDKSVAYTNFLKPFEWEVWCVTLATVLLSAIIYEFLEFLNNERDERTLWKWFEDNLYLSSVNFVQQYAYEPTGGAGRIFGFSMAVWSMVMGATYTANLASLFVEELGQPFKVGDIEDAIRRQYKICTWRGTNADEYIKKRYQSAIRVPMDTEFDTYQGLNNGTCDVTVAAASSWKGYAMDRDYNPSCDLEWVGKTIEEVSSAFAVKADPAIKCTNLIRDVLNYHLLEMQSDGTMELLWDDYYSSNPNKIDCAIANPESEEDSEGDGRRLLSEGVKLKARKLKGGGGGANPGAATNTEASDADSESSSLDIKAMAGTFVLHAVFSAIAIVVGIFSHYRKKSLRAKKNERISDTDDDDLKDHVAGISMASGSCKNGKQVSTLLNKTGPVEEQLHALFEAQREMQQNQDNLAQQMDLVLSLLTKMRQDQLGSMEANEVGANATASSKFSFFSS